MWERFKSGGKPVFDKAWKGMEKVGQPINRLSNKLGSEAFFPTTLDKESEKAARILKSFCTDGFYGEEEIPAQDGPKTKQKVLQKIPQKVIQRAKGLVIFTTMRTGLWLSGSGGSGVLVARKPDGKWSSPSGILLHTAGLGFLVGIDIYDCVIVINTYEALAAFTKLRCTLGGEISVAAGPVGAGGIVDTEVMEKEHIAPIYTYLKSRGFYAGVQIDGTILIARNDENERFYRQHVSVADILAGKVRHPPYELRTLMETLRAAQGDMFDEKLLPTGAPPGDLIIDDGHLFGVPNKDDPDPYGVLALEKEGMSLKEASTKKRASWEEFSFNPSPNSPVHTIVARQSEERPRPGSRRSSWRTSAFANDPKQSGSVRNSMENSRRMSTSDMSTQTDSQLDPPQSPQRPTWYGHHSSKSSVSMAFPYQMQGVPEHEVLNTNDHKLSGLAINNANGYTTPPHTPPTTYESPSPKDTAKSPPRLPPRPEPVIEKSPPPPQPEPVIEQQQQQQQPPPPSAEQEDHEEPPEDAKVEEPTVHSIQTVQPTSHTMVTKARIVNVPKRLPPKLPARNPGRAPATPTPTADSIVSPLNAEERASLEASRSRSDNDADESSVEVSPVESLTDNRLDANAHGAVGTQTVHAHT